MSDFTFRPVSYVALRGLIGSLKETGAESVRLSGRDMTIAQLESLADVCANGGHDTIMVPVPVVAA